MRRDDGRFLHGFAEFDRTGDTDAGSRAIFFKDLFDKTASGNDENLEIPFFGFDCNASGIAPAAFGADESVKRVAAGVAFAASQTLRQQNDFSVCLFFEFIQINRVLDLDQYFVNEQVVHGKHMKNPFDGRIKQIQHKQNKRRENDFLAPDGVNAQG